VKYIISITERIVSVPKVLVLLEMKKLRTIQKRQAAVGRNSKVLI
jgi:hypothetical protein